MDYYSLANILKAHASLNLLLGQRSNGKSYAVKKECVQEAFLGMGDLIYLRRWSLELKEDDVSDYFSDCPVEDITGGEYNAITVFRSRLYLSNTDEEGQITRGRCIGRTAALTAATHLKSVIKRGAFKNIIFEEFCTADGYLPGEPDKLMQFVATVFGVQYSGRVWLIGNTVSRINPYFSAWSLKSIKNLQPGQIDNYRFTQEDGGVVTIAVEFCSSINVPSNMFIGESRKNITEGVWETDAQPHIPEGFGKFKVVYNLLYEYTEYLFLLKVLMNAQNELLLYCVPAEVEEKEKTQRIVSDKLYPSMLATEKLIPLTDGDKIVLELMRRGKVAYSSNLTGTDFKAIIKSKGSL